MPDDLATLASLMVRLALLGAVFVLAGALGARVLGTGDFLRRA